MTQKQNARLLRAYRAAICAEQDGIADALECVILDEMCGQYPVTISSPIMPNKTVEQPFVTTCNCGGSGGGE